MFKFAFHCQSTAQPFRPKKYNQSMTFQIKQFCIFILSILAFFDASMVLGQDKSKFKQLMEELPTPNEYRTASGAPGNKYWQQRADYKIKVELDEHKQTLKGNEEITYFNNSPDELRYIWLQLDANIFANDADAKLIQTGKIEDKMSFDWVERETSSFDGRSNIESVTDASAKPYTYTINKTMMRVNLKEPLRPKQYVVLNIKWNYTINDARKQGGRTGYEFFARDSNRIYEMAQWFPRMCVYGDATGWQHKQFLGKGEFTLPFGKYDVEITVPEDHMVAATGELQNPVNVLTNTQRDRLKDARNSEKPILIVTPEEAFKNEKSRKKRKATWQFYAQNVRDFAWASSRKFIWDAMNVKINEKNVLAMSYYPVEANPLWNQYSTQSVATALRVYSKHTIDYPYPIAISVNGPIGGMEYPMISFNGARPDSDSTYSERTKYSLISVIIHEVGHNFFPMIINSDERQWSWMDEGLNTFVQYLAEKEWDENYPSIRGPARNIVDYMKMDKNTMVPIMTNSESILQFGNNAYGKPATGLNILRETIMGRELFDYAFKEYARRWAFKHPEPADFFRTMEDASGVDLDWFWRGWFYTNDNCDIALEKVTEFHINTQNMDIEKIKLEQQTPIIAAPQQATKIQKKQSLLDFYNTYNPLDTAETDKQKFEKYYNTLTPKQQQILTSGLYFYQIDLTNKGGLTMPVIIELNYEDSTKETKRYPAEIWLSNENKCSKIIITNRKVAQFALDPMLETADVDLSNNNFPSQSVPSRFESFKATSRFSPPNTNPMREEKQTKPKKP